MSDEMDELDALFDEIAAQSSSAKGKEAPLAEALASVEPAVLDAVEVSIQASDEDAQVAQTGALDTEDFAPDAQLSDAVSDANAEGFNHSGQNEDAKICDCGGTDVQMYDRLGPIVRQLHDALRELGYDRSLSSVVEQVSDSQDRLQYIAQLTEQAANKVLNLVDIALPEQDKQLQASRALKLRWDQMYAGELSVDAFKSLVAESRDFIAATADQAEQEKARLMDIMMAQDFQDISGQIIKKVVSLTQQLERELAQLLHDYAPDQVREKVVDLLSGPVAPSSALVQDDVDQMLAELGF
jgi:chemotaxis protein CheZ